MEFTGTVVITNGNDPQVPFIIRCYQSLRDKERGNFSGDFIVFSDNLSKKSIKLLSQIGISLQMVDGERVREWQLLLPSDKHPIGKICKPMIVHEACRLFEKQYQNLIYLDPDILVQSSIKTITDQIIDDGILMSAQKKSMGNSTWPSSQLYRMIQKGHADEEIFSIFKPEVNTGFMACRILFLKKYLSKFIDYMVSEPYREYANSDPGLNNAWHDQDYFRAYIRLFTTKQPVLLDKFYVFHLCDSGFKEVFLQPFSKDILFKKTRQKPTIIHFAGGTWRRFFLIEVYYRLTKYLVWVSSKRAMKSIIDEKPGMIFHFIKFVILPLAFFKTLLLKLVRVFKALYSLFTERHIELSSLYLRAGTRKS